MIDFGVVRPGQTLYLPFSSFASASGASITMSNFAVTDIEIYKDGSTTQRASDNGYTLLDTDGTDFDGITGIHAFSINLADNSDAGFYSAGSRYFIVVSSVTVDSQTVSFLAGRFVIGHHAAILNTTIASLSSQTSFTLTAGPAEDDALNGMWMVIHDVASAVQWGAAVILDYTGASKTVTLAAGTTFTAATTDNVSVMGPMPLQPTTMGRALDVSSGGEAGVDWANIGSPTTSVNLSGTTVKTATDVETDTQDIQSKIGTPAAASIAADLVVIDNFVDDLESRLTAGRAANLDNLDAAITSRSTVTTAQVNAEMVDVVNVDTWAELAAVPGAAATLTQMSRWMYLLARNLVEQTTTTQTVYADDSTTPVADAAVADDGTTFSRAEWS